MFILGAQNHYIILDRAQYVIGRDSVDIVIANDQTISRKHAILHPKPGHLFVEDQNSKYSVFVNGGIETNEAIPKGIHLELQPGHIIRFGRKQSVFRVERHEYKLIASMLTSAEKRDVQKSIALLDGLLLDDWDDSCTHLVMTEAQISSKALQALIKGIPIILPAFFKETLSSIQKKEGILPKESDFIPPITEPYLIADRSMIAINLDRCRLFAGKVFVFMLERHQKQFESAIVLAQGTCKNLETEKIRKKFMLEKNVILVNYVASSQSQASQAMAQVTDFMVKNNRRIIGDSEIGLAVLHCSIEKFCNPEYRFKEDLIASTPPSIGTVLLEETPQEQSISASLTMDTIVIPETENQDSSCMTNAVTNVSVGKRTRSSCAENGLNNPLQPAKKQKLQRQESSSIGDIVHGVKQVEIAVDPMLESQLDHKPLCSSTQKISNNLDSQCSSDSFVKYSQQIPSSNDFLSSQNRSVTRNSSVIGKPVSNPILTGSKKRAFDALKANDDQDDIFNFDTNVKPKKPKHGSGRNTRSKDTAKDDEDLFNFANPNTSVGTRSQRTRRSQQPTKQNEPSISTSTTPVQQVKKPIEKVEYHQRIPLTSTGWISKTELIKKDTVEIKIKDEPLDESQMTDDNLKRLWLKSMEGACLVHELDPSYIQYYRDEVDSNTHALPTNSSVKNFKKFVKVTNSFMYTS